MFDVLTYQKGGALLRMLEQYLGTDRFRDGIRMYLAKHSYGNTETSDLWDAIESAVAQTGGEPVRAMMDSWIWQPGYPLIRAEIDQSTLVLRQERFDFGSTPGTQESRWIVPIHLRIADRETKVLLDSGSLRIPLERTSDPIVVNAGGHGFFRVAYSNDLLSRLKGRFLTSMKTIERYTLVDDAWNAVVADRLTAAQFLEFVDGFTGERDYAVWQCIAQGLRSLGRLIEGDAHLALRARIRDLVRPALDEIGWDPTSNESDLIGKLRGLLVTVLAVNGDDAETRDRCRKIFSDHLAGNAHIHPELVAAATTVTAATGDRADFDLIRSKYTESDNPQEQLRYLYALCEFDQPGSIRSTCEFAMSSAVKSQNAPFILGRCIAARVNGHVAWDFVKENWDRANTEFPVNSIIRMVDPVKLLNTSDRVRDAREFFASHPIPQGAKILEQILERHVVNERLRSREETRFGEYLVSRPRGGDRSGALLRRILPGRH